MFEQCPKCIKLVNFGLWLKIQTQCELFNSTWYSKMAERNYNTIYYVLYIDSVIWINVIRAATHELICDNGGADIMRLSKSLIHTLIIDFFFFNNSCINITFADSIRNFSTWEIIDAIPVINCSLHDLVVCARATTILIHFNPLTSMMICVSLSFALSMAAIKWHNNFVLVRAPGCGSLVHKHCINLY